MNIIERLRYYGEIIPSSEEMMREASDEIEQLRAKLAASQAREKVLRTGLRSAFDHIEMASLEASHCNDAARISDALACRSDDTALRQAIRAAKEEMRERCANACITSCDTVQALQAIRSLEVE